MLCAYFKVGTCEKGSKCKFSHDLNVGRKVEKKNLYEDSREEKMDGVSVLRERRLARFSSSAAMQIRWINGTLRNWRVS